MDTDPNTDTRSDIGIEGQPQITRLFTDGKRAYDQPTVTEHQHAHTKETEFFGNNGENKIGMRFRQKPAFAQTCPQTHTEPVASPDRHQRLGKLIACVLFVLPRVEKGQHPLHTVRGGGNHQRHPAQNTAHQNEKIFPRQTRKESDSNDGNHDKRTEIRLEHHQRQAERHQHDRQDNRPEAVIHFFGFAARLRIGEGHRQIGRPPPNRPPAEVFHTAQHFFAAGKQAGQIQDDRQLK